MRRMKNLTYRNLMAVIREIEKKGYNFDESARIARLIFAEYNPSGMSIETMVSRILTKEEWESQYN